MDRVLHLPERWSAGVDYLRVTLSRSHPDYDLSKIEYAAAVRAAGRAMGEDIRNARRWLWCGYYGESLGSASWGEGPQGLVLQASGVAATEVLGCRWNYSNVPRIDLQATYWYPERKEDIAMACALQAKDNWLDARGRRPKVRLIQGMGDGDTCYVGTRGKNAKFLRVYDKERESGREEYAGAWRFEMELTDEHAKRAFMALRRYSYNPRTILEYVSMYMREKSIWLPVPVGGEPVELPRVRREETSVYRTLEWFERGVAPSIDRLRNAGVELEEILVALGLQARSEGSPTVHEGAEFM